MPGTEVIEVFKAGTDIPVLDHIETIEVSDEQLAEADEVKAMERAEELIDNISNLNEAKAFLQRLVKRLIDKGVLS